MSFAFCGKIEQANRYFCSRVWGTFHHDKGIKSSIFRSLRISPPRIWEFPKIGVPYFGDLIIIKDPII